MSTLSDLTELLLSKKERDKRKTNTVPATVSFILLNGEKEEWKITFGMYTKLDKDGEVMNAQFEVEPNESHGSFALVPEFQQDGIDAFMDLYKNEFLAPDAAGSFVPQRGWKTHEVKEDDELIRHKFQENLVEQFEDGCVLVMKVTVVNMYPELNNLGEALEKFAFIN